MKARFTLFSLTVIIATLANAADPEATIHSVKQLPGTKTVEIVYSATDEDGDDLDVSINIESNGTSIASLSGSKGEDITKRWNAGTDWNGNAAELTFTVVADDDANTPTNGLIAYYPFDNDSMDHSGNDNHGSWNGGEHTSAVVGDGYRFSRYKFFSANIPQTDVLTSFSLCGWFKGKKTHSHGEYLFSKGNEGYNTQEIGIEFHGSPEDLMGRIKLLDGTWIQTAKHPVSGIMQNWHHYAVTFDSIAIKMYVDGDIVASESGNAGTIETTGYPFHINRHTWTYWGNEASSRLEGVVDESACI